jgi:hypothetical protein
MASFNGMNWVIFDNFEMTGFCWNSNSLTGNGGNVMISYYSGSGQNTTTPYFVVIENNYLHGWTYTTGGTQGGASAMAGNAGYSGAVIQFNVVDGQDSDDLAISALGNNDTDMYIVRYNVFRRFGGDIVSSSCHYIHDNLFEYYNFETDGSGHGDAFFCENEYSGGSSAPNIFFNNLWRYIGTTYNQSVSYIPNLGTPSGQTDYIFNNVWHDNQPTSTSNYLSDEDRSGTWTLFNNTVELPTTSGAGCFVCAGTNAATSVNNHWILTPASQSGIFKNAPSSETEAVYMTNSTATTQGYTSSNDFAPTASTNSTVTASGTNETTGYCADSVLHYSIAESACTAGMTNRCSYNTSGNTVNCPAITANLRPPTGAWNVGAYQYSSSTAGAQPSAPTGLTATVQ